MFVIIKKIPGKELWRGDWLPCTTLQRKEDQEIKSFNGGGIVLTPLEPMRKWKIHFEGTVCLIDNSKEEKQNTHQEVFLPGGPLHLNTHISSSTP